MPVDTSPTPPDTTPEPVVRAWPAMGTTLRVIVWDADTTRALAAMERARGVILRVDSLMSAAHPGSELAAANRRAGTDTATALSPWTAAVLDSAMAIAAASGGAFDPTAAPLLAAWRIGEGDADDDDAAPSPSVRAAAGALADWRKVRFDRATRRTSLAARGMRLDLGGSARGFAIDRGIEALRAAGVTRGVIDLGGNFAVMGPGPVASRWSVGLKNPFEPGQVFAGIQVDDAAALATAGSYEPYFAAEGVLYSHLVDPRTRGRAHGVADVSVIAPSALLADMLARALFVLGPEAGCRMLARYPAAQAVWVRAPAEDEEDDEDRDADDGVDPRLVVITDNLAEHLELLSEEPITERATRCSELAAR